MKITPRTWDRTANNELENLDSSGATEDSRQIAQRSPTASDNPLNDWKLMILGRLTRKVNRNMILCHFTPASYMSEI
jgi:hypothetical protein